MFISLELLADQQHANISDNPLCKYNASIVSQKGLTGWVGPKINREDKVQTKDGPR